VNSVARLVLRAAAPMITCGAVLCCLCACTAAPPASSAKALATVAPSNIGVELSSTGFFVDNDGHLLTARHAARDCAQLYVAKEDRVLTAKLVASSEPLDLALLKIEETLGLPAVFTRRSELAANDMVFAAGYEALQDVLAQGGALFNAVVADTDPRGADAEIELVSDATYGASGAPVLGSTGLVIGMITHRGLEGRVFATSAEKIKAFLAASHFAYDEDDRPQLGTLQDRAHRAETISANVLCFKRS
jgi:S1-C subfamily serine protease